MAEVGSAYVTVLPSAKGFGSKLNSQVGGDVEKSGKTVGKRFGGAIKLGATALIGGVVGGFLKSSLGEAREAQKVGAQTAAVIKSTGGAAKVTAGQVSKLATSLSTKVGIDDEVIQSGQNMLLTFKNIRNEAGRGNKIFDQATKTLVDMSVALGEDPKQAAIKFGKALNDPIKGMTALSRVGVTFSDKQKAVITKMVKTGDILGAQKVILKELNSEFGGSAKAQATAGDKARVAWQNLEETIGTALLPTVDKLQNVFTTKVAPAISKFVGEMQNGSGAGGRFADSLGNIAATGKSIVGFFTGLPGPVKKFGVELAIAALAMSRLNSFFGPGISSLGTFASSMRSAEFRAATFSQKMQGIGTGLRGFAGAAGLGLVVDSTTRASGGFSTLESAAGGALSGASLGAFAGPAGAAVGAAIGGIGGLVLGLSRHTREAGDSAKYAVDGYSTLASTLDQVTGATTAATRQLVFQKLTQSGAVKTLAEYGIGAREATNAIVQGGPAREKFISTLTRAKQGLSDGTAAAKKYRDSLVGGNDQQALKSANESYNAIKKNNDAKKHGIDLALGEVGATAKAVTAKQKEIAATRTFSKAINTLPKAVQTELKTKGLEPTRKAVVDLTRKYHLTPKQVKTLIGEQGGTPTKKMILGVIADAKALDRQHPHVKVSADTSQARAEIDAFIHSQSGRHLNLTVTAHQNGLARGGPVRAGQTYLVGERGPELFSSNQAGRITPNNRLSASGGTALAAAGGGAMALTITNWEEGTGYIEAVSDTRYYANGALAR